MPVLELDGRSLYYEVAGSGEPVLLVPGSGARGRTWLHQASALARAGYRAVTIDNRGAGLSTPVPKELYVDDLVTDVRDFAAEFFDGPYRVVGTSLGALVVQELLLTTSDVSQAVIIAGKARPDAYAQAMSVAERAIAEGGVVLPPAYEAAVRAGQNLSPRTLSDREALRIWLDLFEMSPMDLSDSGTQAQFTAELTKDRRSAYAGITTPCLVMSFADDLLVPPAGGRELADTIPGARYVVIPDAGHLGCVERPEEVNKELLDFFAAPGGTATGAGRADG